MTWWSTVNEDVGKDDDMEDCCFNPFGDNVTNVDDVEDGEHGRSESPGC